MNSFTASGWVKRPELKVTTTGKTVLKFALAIMNPKRDGQEKASYTYCNCAFWGADAVVEEGTEVLVHGTFYNSSYEKKDGSKGYDTGMNVQTMAEIRKGKAAEFKKSADPDGEELPF